MSYNAKKQEKYEHPNQIIAGASIKSHHGAHSKMDNLPHYVPLEGTYEGVDSDFYAIAPIVNPLGIHSRPSALIVKAASRYNCDVSIQKLSEKAIADAKSIMSVIVLAASRGEILLIRAKDRGENEARVCVQNLADLVKVGFNEMNELDYS